jgi:hypothetical protein
MFELGWRTNLTTGVVLADDHEANVDFVRSWGASGRPCAPACSGVLHPEPLSTC